MSITQVPKCPDGVPAITISDYLCDYEFKNVYIETIPDIRDDMRFRRFMYAQMGACCVVYFTHGTCNAIKHVTQLCGDHTYAPPVCRAGWTIASDTGPWNYDVIMRNIGVDPYDVCHLMPYFRISNKEFMNKCTCTDIADIHRHGPNTLAHYLADDEYISHGGDVLFSRPEFMLDEEHLWLIQRAFAHMMRSRMHINIICGASMMTYMDEMLSEIYDERDKYIIDHNEFYKQHYPVDVINKIKIFE